MRRRRSSGRSTTRISAARHERTGDVRRRDPGALFRDKPMTNLAAKQYATEMLALDEAEIKARRTMRNRVMRALPAVKAARYMQLENKIRAVQDYDVAADGAADALTASARRVRSAFGRMRHGRSRVVSSRRRCATARATARRVRAASCGTRRRRSTSSARPALAARLCDSLDIVDTLTSRLPASIAAGATTATGERRGGHEGGGEADERAGGAWFVAVHCGLLLFDVLLCGSMRRATPIRIHRSVESVRFAALGAS